MTPLFRRSLPAAVLAFLTLVAAVPAPACTTFCLRDDGRIVFGKNYDWAVDDGLLIVNKRGVARTADVVGDPRPASWVSRYGSVTFNQYGRDFPMGGMNEKGLTIELMWLDGTRYPQADARPSVDVLQWIQYQLDNHATVAEVLKADKSVRIVGSAPLHYLVADRQGQVATVEFLDGRMWPTPGTSSRSRPWPTAPMPSRCGARRARQVARRWPASPAPASGRAGSTPRRPIP